MGQFFRVNGDYNIKVRDGGTIKLDLLPAAQNELATIEREAAAIRARALQGLDVAQADATMAALRIMQRNLSGR